jgi:hypothetical protein
LPEPLLVCLQTSELVSKCEWHGNLVLFLVNHSSISGEVFQDAGTHVVLGFVSAKQKGYNVTITRQTLMRAQQPNSSSSQNPTYMRLQGKEDEDQVQASSLSGALETVPEEVGDFFF